MATFLAIGVMSHVRVKTSSLLTVGQIAANDTPARQHSHHGTAIRENLPRYRGLTSASASKY